MEATTPKMMITFAINDKLLANRIIIERCPNTPLTGLSVLLTDTQAAGETLKRLKDTGVAIAMDDFGTGFSSLSYLRRFPVDIVKIDHEFIRNISTNAPDEALVETIIYMAHRLGLKVVAEGVETEEQLALLRRYACDAIQGHVFGPAMAHDQLLTRIHSQKDVP